MSDFPNLPDSTGQGPIPEPATAPEIRIAQEDLLPPPKPRPDPPFTWGDVVRIALVALLAVVLFSFVAIAAVHGITGKQPTADEVGHNPRVIVPAQGAAYAVVILFMYLIVTRVYGRPFLQGIHWRFPARRWPAFLAAGVGLAVAVQLISAFLPIPKQLPIDEYFRDSMGAWMMAGFGVLVAPLVEEMFFRGFLYPVARRMGLVAGLAITSLVFALIHEAQLAQAWAPLLMLFVVGLALTITREVTDSLASSVIVHVAYNATLFVAVWIASDHFRHLEKLK